jgi:hypothetical protein
MPTIYQQTPAPWKTNQATITTFKSGLLRVDQEYLVPTASLADYYPRFLAGEELTDIDSPAMDGLYIYPTPQFQNRGDGLTAINVSAYGRVSNQVTDASYFEERVNVSLISRTIKYITGDFPGFTSSIYSFSLFNRRGSVVLASGESISDLDFQVEPQYAAPFNFSGANNSFEADSRIGDLKVTEVTPEKYLEEGQRWYEVQLGYQVTNERLDLGPPFILFPKGSPYPGPNKVVVVNPGDPTYPDYSTPLVMLPPVFEIINTTYFGYWTEYEFIIRRNPFYIIDSNFGAGTPIDDTPQEVLEVKAVLEEQPDTFWQDQYDAFKKTGVVGELLDEQSRQMVENRFRQQGLLPYKGFKK